MAIATLIVLPLLLSLGSTPSCESSGEFQSAKDAFANGDFKGSFVRADKARKSTDEKRCLALLYLLQAKCLSALSMPKKVRDSLVKAISLDPDVSFDMKGDDPELVDRLEKLKVELKLKPRGQPEADEEIPQVTPAPGPCESSREFHSAEDAWVGGDFEGSMRLLEKARESTLDRKCSALLYLLQAKCLLALSRTSEIRDSLVQALMADPDVSFDLNRDDPDLIVRLEKLKVKPRRKSQVDEELSQEEPAPLPVPRDSASRPPHTTRQRLERPPTTDRSLFKDEVGGSSGALPVEKQTPFSPQLAAGIGLTVVAALAAVFSVYGYVEAQGAKNELLAQSTPIDPVARRQLIDHGTTMNQLGFGALVVAGAAGVGGVVCFAGRF